MSILNIGGWGKYAIEFLSIFIAVLSAFALNNWNDNRKSDIAETRILSEISSGLSKDLEDVNLNYFGHKSGISSCQYWRRLANGDTVSSDSLVIQLVRLTRDFISIQNTAGYESLKSKGFETIKNDSIRLDIISIYEYDFNILRKLEEETKETQFHTSYFMPINEIIAPYLEFDDQGMVVEIKQPIVLNEIDKKRLLSYLLKIELNRNFILRYYKSMEVKIEKLINDIETELE